jgi:hypothetical protein
VDVTKLTLDKIFDPTVRLEAPLFQRPYVWKRQLNWSPLWKAIRQIADKRFEEINVRPHFLGTVVLDQLKTPTGSLYARQIIDGQQRLTTLQIVLAAIRDICENAGQENFRKAFAKLTDNDTPLSDDPDDVFKVWPTNADRNFFRLVMSSRSAKTIGKLPLKADEELLIPEAYLYFSDKVSEWLDSLDEVAYLKRLRALYETIKDQLNLVVIDLDEHDDAQEIFETLNALGTPLLPADLVKNFLFHRADAEELNTQRLYDLYWKQFDDERGFWRKEVGQGRFKRARLDWFLQHYMTLLKGEEAVISQLFSSFRDHVEKNVRPTADYLEEFRHYAAIYKSFEEFPAATWQSIFFYRLGQLETTTIFPLLLEVFNTTRWPRDDNETHQICLDLESFLIRRVVCQLTTKNYNKFFGDVIDRLRHKGNFSAASLREILRQETVDTSRWPDDEEFREAWMNTQFYKRLYRTRVRIILEALNHAMQSDKTEKITLHEKLTIEHLMPQEWRHNWPLAPDGDEDERNFLLHTIGNLTLLTKKLNPAISNSEWKIKKPEILKHSAIALNRRFYQIDPWDEECITTRTEELFALALRIWPYPNSLGVHN